METTGPTLTLEIVTFAIHEDVVHEHHAEHAGIDMEVAEDKCEVCWLQNRESCAFVASRDSPLPTPNGDLCITQIHAIHPLGREWHRPR